MNITKSILIIPLAGLLLLTGCANHNGYKKLINDFQTASSVVTQSAGVYITQLNKTQRDAYIDRQVNKGAEIKLNKVEEFQVFSSKSIQARLDALTQLASYGTLLGRLANSDTPQRITSNAEELKVSLDKLNEDVNTLTGNEDAKFKNALGPAALIMGEIARFAVERKIQDSLNTAILKGEKPVTDLIDVLKHDLTQAYDLHSQAVQDSAVNYINGYHIELKKKSSLDKLRKRGQEIKSALDIREELPKGDPSYGLYAMGEAHKALVDYAKSPRNQDDLKNLAEQMEIFAERAKRVGKVVQQLQ